MQFLTAVFYRTEASCDRIRLASPDRVRPISPSLFGDSKTRVADDLKWEERRVPGVPSCRAKSRLCTFIRQSHITCQFFNHVPYRRSLGQLSPEAQIRARDTAAGTRRQSKNSSEPASWTLHPLQLDETHAAVLPSHRAWPCRPVGCQPTTILLH